MTKTKLTDKNILTLAGGDREINHGDAQFPGLYLRVTPGGARSFVLRYSDRGRQRRHTLGKVGVLTVADARHAAADFLARVSRGESPDEPKQTSCTVKRLSDDYIKSLEARVARGRGRAITVRLYRQCLRDYILPAIGRKDVADVKRRHVKELLDKVPNGVQGRCLSIVRGTFELALDLELVETLPTIGIKSLRNGNSERHLSIEEIQKVGAAIALLRAAVDRYGRPRYSGIHLDCILALMVSGARRNEMASLRWEDVDLAQSVITLIEFKGVTRGLRTTKEIYISDALLRILKRRSLERINEFVFPAVVARGGPSHIKNLHSAWTAVLKQAGIKHARIHDLRHSFVSIGVDKGIVIPSLGGAVGHANPAVTAQVYAHLGRDRVRTTVNDVSSTINAALNGS